MITIPVTGYAIVLACSINAGTPDCIEQLATGYVWANAQRCQEELKHANIPGAQCQSLSGITVLQIELDGATEWLLTTDIDLARQHLADIFAREIRVMNLIEVLHEQYGGIATLETLG